jgi:cytochrome b involved in lipid metabolism
MILLNIRELAFHNDSSENKKLLAIDNLVYDVGPFLNRHPGGDTNLRIYLGRNCSEEFTFIHGSSPPKMILDSLLVGKIIEPEFSSNNDRVCWYELLKYLDQLVALINIFNIETEVFKKKCFRDDSEHWNPYKDNLFEILCERIESYYLPYLETQLQKFGISHSNKNELNGMIDQNEKTERSCNLYIFYLKQFFNENLMRSNFALKALEK